MDLGRVDRITHIMSFTVGHIGDQTFRLAQFLADQLHDIDVLHLVVSADIVYLTDASFVDHQIDRLAVIFHIQPVSYVQTFPVNRKRLVMQCIDHHQRDQFLREMIRTVVVGAAADGHRQSEGSVICQHQKVCACLGRTVRAAGMDRCLFGKEQIRAVQRKITVYFVGRYLMITLNAVLSAGIHQYGSTHDVGLQEDPRILNGTVYVALCRKVYHHIRMLFLEKFIYRFPVRDAFLYKAEIRIVHNGSQCGKISRIGQAVQTNDAIVRILVQHMENKVTADKTCAACYDNCHCSISFHRSDRLHCPCFDDTTIQGDVTSPSSIFLKIFENFYFAANNPASFVIIKPFFLPVFFST